MLQTEVATQLSGRQNLAELYFNGKILTSGFLIIVLFFLHLNVMVPLTPITTKHIAHNPR